MRTNKGFTIVELLIVIVIIAILVAITAVAYTGITKQANTAQAQSNASSVRKVSESCYAINATYPSVSGTAPDGTITCTGAVATLPTGVKVITATAAESYGLTAANGKNTVAYNGTTGAVYYWDFVANTGKAL